MGNFNKHLPETFIKSVAIELNENFDFHHHPFEIEADAKQNNGKKSDPKKFYGRDAQIDKFSTLLSLGKKGVFLVTGYRGMGKTSFVNHSINRYKEEEEKKGNNKRHIKTVHLTMAQNNPKEFDLLRQITNSIFNEYDHKYKKIIDRLRMAEKAVLLIIVYFLTTKIFFGWGFNFGIDSNSTIFDPLTVCFFLLCVLIFWKTYCISKDSNKEKIRELMDRCHSTMSEERGHEGNFSFLSSLLDYGLSNKHNAKTGKNYPIADSKVIEFELIDFLKKVSNKYKFIFIIDELDKIEVSNHATNLNEDLESFENRNKNTLGSNQFRNRRQAVLNIIAGLKNFFTIAEARFIFVAGREMFDASLADVADKQSPLSSIFTYVFHIETLLKEKGDDNNYSSLSITIERFLRDQLFAKECETELNNTSDNRKKTLAELLKEKKGHGLTDKQFAKIEKEDKDKAVAIKQETEANSYQAYFLLQAFITYLIYRSSGSPKKIIKTFLEFVHTEGTLQTDDKYVAYLHNNLDSYTPTPHKPRRFLYFNNSNQYRIGFINSIYRPFIIQYGRNYKSFSENTVISIPYYFDHLFKFHPFAFSVSNLELIPELLYSNKTPNAGDDLKNVINYLYQSHIRDTDIELFDYKFHSKTTNEIMYISKLFEEEGAAFNFTLDESYHIKLYLSEKIKEYRSTHSKFNVDTNTNGQVFSIASLNSSLGDVYFFDQEYHDAIHCYADAIRSINHLELNKINFRDFITLIRNKLKIGLCFEKINSFEEAMSFYADSVQDIKRYYNYFLSTSLYIQEEIEFLKDVSRENLSAYERSYYTSSLNDMQQICIQAFLSNVIIQEKMGLEGVTTPKVKVEMNEFFRLADNVSSHMGRNQFIIANWKLHHGKMLYFKNSPHGTSEIGIKPERNECPDWLSEKLKELRVIHSAAKPKLNLENRQPIMAYKSYIMGLDEILKSKDYFFEKASLYHNSKVDESGTTYDSNYAEKYSGHYTNLTADPNNWFLFKTVEGQKAQFLRNYLQILFEFISEKGFANHANDAFIANHYKYIANFLSSIGDCLLGMNDLQNETNSIFMPVTDFLTPINTDCFYSSLNKSTELDRFAITDVFRCYFLSAKFYKKYGRNASAVFEYRKIFTLMVTIIDEKRTPIDPNKFITLLFNSLLRPAEEMLHTSKGRTHRHMLAKIEEDLPEINLDKNWSKFKNTINHSEVKELYLLFEEIKNKIGVYDEEFIDILLKPKYASMSSQFLRILELELYCRTIYRQQIQKLEEEKDHVYDDYLQPTISFLFSRHSILRILKIYETDYVFGPSYKAFVHYEIAKLLNLDVKKQIADKETLKLWQYLNGDAEFKRELQSLLGGKSMVLIDAEYHYGMALDFYEKAIELHTAGNEYKKQIKNMIFLEDDFNDNDFHFGAAMERYLMINGFFSKRINQIKEQLKELRKMEEKV